MVGNQSGQAVPDLMEEDEESDDESETSEDSNWNPEMDSQGKEDVDWEASPNGKLHPNSRSNKHKGKSTNSCILRKGVFR